MNSHLTLVMRGKKTKLFDSLEETNFFTQFIGLMFKKQAKTPLLFKGNGRMAIHSFFCPSFDAVFLNKEKRAVHLQTVQPATPRVAANAFFLLELPLGTISRFKLKKGDKFTWNNQNNK